MLHSNGSRNKAFSLMEILCVLAIIALLCALLLVTYQNTRGSARETVCFSQMRQIGLAIKMYQSDYSDIPPTLEPLYPNYVKDRQVFRCPVWETNYQAAPEWVRTEASAMLSHYNYKPQMANSMHNSPPEPGEPDWVRLSWDEYLEKHGSDALVMQCKDHNSPFDSPEKRDLNAPYVTLDMLLDTSVHRRVSTLNKLARGPH